MAWIELHQTRQRHPKTLRLASALGISRREACGLLDDLWTWALDAAQIDGLLLGMSATDIAVALDYPHKQGAKLLDALTLSGYMDVTDGGEYALHDWYDYAGKLNERRQRDAEYQRKKRTIVVRKSPDVGTTSARHRAVPYPTVPNRTVQYNKEPSSYACDTDDTTPADTLSAYFSSNLKHMSAGNYDELRQFLADGVSDDLARFAVDTATAAGRQSWGFVRYLLDQWIAADCKTVGDAKAYEQRRMKDKARGSPSDPNSRPYVPDADDDFGIEKNF